MNPPRFKFSGSLRWQLQLWHGLILALVLSGFGWTAWQLQRASLFNGVDQELEQHAQIVIHSMHLDRPPGRARGAPPGRGQEMEPSPDLPPPGDRQSRMAGMPPPPSSHGPPGIQEGLPPEPPGDNLPEGIDPYHPAEIEGDEFSKNTIYAVVWGFHGREIFHSRLAPVGIPHPSSRQSQPMIRLRGEFREHIRFLPSGEYLLVGKNVQNEFQALHRIVFLLAAAGGVVLLFGLLIGWLITSGALRPLLSISVAAKKIAEGDLSQRIPMPRTENEISDLVRVLNQTFSRLEASFDRQLQFTADASHELRTPISVVLTHAQNALARVRSPAEYRESLEACQRAARRMRQLTESLLALVRLDNGDGSEGRMVCRLDQIDGDAVELLAPLALEQHIAVSFDPDPVSFAGNPEQIAQVAINLVTNAIRYNSAGGMVNVQTRSEQGFAVLSVRDTGCGIAGEDIPHIFERFYRADRSRSGNSAGAGLGLAITEAIVKTHGGSIEVKSELGSGSLFTVKLPAL